MRLALAALLAAASLPALAAAQNSVTPPVYAGAWEGGSAYGAYLAGRAALNRGNAGAAAEYLTRAAAEAPGQAFLDERAFTAAILAGDVPRAAAIADGGRLDAPGAADLATLVRATEALASGQGREARKLLQGPFTHPPAVRAAALLRPVVAAAAGDWKTATEPAPATGNRTLDAVARLTRADLLELRGRHDEAMAEHDLLAREFPDTPFLILARAAFLERRGRTAEAVAVYDAALKLAPGDADLLARRARAEAGRDRSPTPTLDRTAANALAALAGASFAERQAELAVAYLRLSLRLDPTQGQNWVLLGDVFNAIGQRAAARQAWRSVPDDARQKPDALLRLAGSLVADEPEAALALARDAAERSSNPRANLAVAEILSAQEKYAEAVDLLRAEPLEDEPRWWFLLGAALERSGRWTEAEPILSKALELRPDDPEILNYVGYSWIDRGIKLKEGLALVEKAVAAAPQSGAIQDSLAWAHYRLGDYDKAVELLELAVKLEPGNPEINDHLGDAYWKTGRRIEAEFQWRRVLTLDPSPAQKASVESKLKSGLPNGTRPL
jgi:Flp pilus assembly protein TadD